MDFEAAGLPEDAARAFMVNAEKIALNFELHARRLEAIVALEEGRPKEALKALQRAEKVLGKLEGLGIVKGYAAEMGRLLSLLKRRCSKGRSC